MKHDLPHGFARWQRCVQLMERMGSSRQLGLSSKYLEALVQLVLVSTIIRVTFITSNVWAYIIEAHVHRCCIPAPCPLEQGRCAQAVRPGWGSMCVKACCPPPLSSDADPGRLAGSGVPQDSPLVDDSLWDSALTKPSSARSSVIYLNLIFFALQAIGERQRQSVGSWEGDVSATGSPSQMSCNTHVIGQLMSWHSHILWLAPQRTCAARCHPAVS